MKQTEDKRLCKEKNSWEKDFLFEFPNFRIFTGAYFKED